MMCFRIIDLDSLKINFFNYNYITFQFALSNVRKRFLFVIIFIIVAVVVYVLIKNPFVNEEESLILYSWPGYVDTKTLKNFTDGTGVRIVLKEYRAPNPLKTVEEIKSNLVYLSAIPE